MTQQHESGAAPLQLSGETLERVVAGAVRGAVAGIGSGDPGGPQADQEDLRRSLGTLTAAIGAIERHAEERQTAVLRAVVEQTAARVAAAREQAEGVLRRAVPELGEETLRQALAGFAVPAEAEATEGPGPGAGLPLTVKEAAQAIGERQRTFGAGQARRSDSGEASAAN